MNERDLAVQTINTVKTGLWQKCRGPVLICIGILILLVIAYFAWQRHSATEAKLQEAVALTQRQATDVNTLQNSLNESKQNAQMLADYINRALTGQVQPVANLTIQAPSLPAATQQVVERINQNDPTLPPLALEKTDRTVVVPNENKTPQANYDVGVFKVNNYRNWEWSTGYGQHGGDRYIPVEVQRNYSKDAAVSYEQHFGGKQSGYEVKYTRKTDKLLFLF